MNGMINDIEKELDSKTISWHDALNNFNMKQKVLVYNMNMDSSLYFSSYEEAAKHLDTKVDTLKRIVNTDEKVSNVYLIRTLNK